MSSALLLLLLALPAAAQTWTGDAFCICPGGKRGHVKLPDTCESFCGGASGGFTAPQHDPYAQQRRDQEAAERARRVREDAERAARAERERLEKERRFQRDKREALSQLKGVTVAEPQLKGVGGDSGGLKGLKGVDGPEPGLKGLKREKEAPRRGAAQAEGRTCRVTDPCRASMAEQASALESARAEQGDLYLAAGTADLGHGLDLAEGAVKDSGAMGRVSVYVWKSQDRFGVPQYADDYKAAVDEAAELVDEETLDAGTKGLGSKAKTLKKTVETMDAFSRYMKTLLSCSKGRDADFDRCASDAAKNFSTTLDGLPIAEASKARVKAAAGALGKYSTNALKRAMRASDAASRCLAACP